VLRPKTIVPVCTSKSLVSKRNKIAHRRQLFTLRFLHGEVRAEFSEFGKVTKTKTSLRWGCLSGKGDYEPTKARAYHTQVQNATIYETPLDPDC
jgi:hypothetical protein